MVISVKFDEEADFKKINDDEMVLECPCGGDCYVLRD
jgi:hypothetical protein